MTHERRIVIAVALLLFLLAGLFPPWKGSFIYGNDVHYTASPVYRLIFTPPFPDQPTWIEYYGTFYARTIDLPVLAVEWILIIVLAFGALLLLPGPAQPRPRPVPRHE